MKDILLGIDLTAESSNAFDRAILLARVSGAKLHVLHVKSGQHEAAQRTGVNTVDAGIIREIENQIAERSSGQSIDHSVHIEPRGRVHELINRYSRQLRADLVVIGRSQRGGALPGSVLLTSGQTVVHSSCPVLVVSEPARTGYGNILLEVDASGRTGNMLAPVCDFGPDIHIRIVGILGAAEASSVGVVGKLRAWMRGRKLFRLQRYAIDLLQAKGLSGERVSLEMGYGDPLKLLEKGLEAMRFDVVALSNLRVRLLDPASADLIRRTLNAASCDVLVYER